MFEFYNAVVPPERREKHRLEKIKMNKIYSKTGVAMVPFVHRQTWNLSNILHNFVNFTRKKCVNRNIFGIKLRTEDV